MSHFKKIKHRSLAEKVLFRKHLVRSWRNYDFYLKSLSPYSKHKFLSDYKDDCFCFSILGVSLHSFLVHRERDEKYVRKIFNEDGYSFRKERLERIKKLKKHGKAKLLVGHLFDDIKKDDGERFIFDPLPRNRGSGNSDANCSRNLGTKSLEELIKKLVELNPDLCHKNFD